MSRYHDYTGVKQTCPLIDSVIQFIGNIEWDEGEEDLEKRATEAEKILEEIRQMNSDLRDFGNARCKEAEEMEKEKDYYENRCKDLESDVESLKDEIKMLEKELSNVETP